MHDQLSVSLITARDSMNSAIKLSKQGSYHRRAPSAESLPHYGEARRALLQILEQEPNNREALLMMSQVSEGLMNFKAAIHNLEKAFLAGEPRSKKHLKKLALLWENAKDWKDLLLKPEDLRELGDYLMSMGVGSEHRTLELTRNWLAEREEYDTGATIAALAERGAFSDFQVLANVVYG